MDENIVLHDKIAALIEEKKFKELKELLRGTNPIDIAEALNGLSEKELILAFRLLDKDHAADTFVAMETEEQQALIGSFNEKELHDVVGELGVDDAVDIIEEMPANVVSRILQSTDNETRKLINSLLLYPEDSAGSIMTPEYVSLRKDMTVEDAFDKIRAVGLDKETIYTCYVTENRKLVGVVSARSMLVSAKTTKISEIMHSNFISVSTTDDKEFVAGQIKKYGFLAIPVVDKEEKLVGIVTIDDAMDVMEEEATEDIQKMAAILPTERSYIRSGVFSIWKQRIPWLLLLMVSATFTSKIIGKYEAALSACIVLSSFIPMIMDTGGNAGSQASVTIIRGLSLDEIKIRDILKIIWKEFRVAFMCGLTLAPVTFLKVMFVDGLYNEPDGIVISLVVSVTLFMTICVAKLVGCVLPIAAKAVHLDPAVMASPFITTIVDAISLVVYFTFASHLVPALS
ncbi:MAG: magnesium transporter [Eubacteriales bacterium]